MDLTPVTLTGRAIRLEPMTEAHIAGLCDVGLDERIWRLLVYGNVRTEADMRAWVLDILSRQGHNTDLPFVVVHQAENRVVGATRYMNVSHHDRGLEIGGTWYGVDYQGTAVNPEAKLLLLRYAFEKLKVIRVQIKTDLRNLRSQRAIEKLGAVKEGVLRNHMILEDGYVRNSVVYSILPDEWPAVRQNLLDRLGYDPVQG